MDDINCGFSIICCISDCIPGLCIIPIEPGVLPEPAVLVVVEVPEGVVVLVVVVAEDVGVVLEVVASGVEPRGAQGFGMGSLFSRPA